MTAFEVVIVSVGVPALIAVIGAMWRGATHLGRIDQALLHLENDVKDLQDGDDRVKKVLHRHP